MASSPYRRDESALGFQGEFLVDEGGLLVLQFSFLSLEADREKKWFANQVRL